MFEINTGLIFWTALSFIIMVILLYKLVFPPLYRVIDQRRAAIDKRLEEAKKAQSEAEDLLKKYETKLVEAEKTSASIFEDAQRKSQALRDEALKNAQKEAYKIIEDTKKDIDGLKRKALFDLKEDITKVVVDVSGRLIKKNLNVKDHIKLIESSISELDKNAKKKI